MNCMSAELVLGLAELDVEILGTSGSGALTLEHLMSGHGIDEMAASILPVGCCSCSIPCCCCCD
jgi:hypothetical protein